MSAGPLISVVVASHDRPLRLRWLLNALEEQTLEREHWEVVVAHDSRGPETGALLAEHPLAGAGALRSLAFAPGSAGPAAKRNAAWRAALGATILFTDDDCRPPPSWIADALAAVGRHPGAIVQGSTRPDPDELALAQRAPHALTQTIDPPTPWAQTCNIAYPRAVLEGIGGFDETLPVAAGEDTDLALRARAQGVDQIGAPEVRTFHAVEPVGLIRRVRGATRWQHLAYVVGRHPRLRRTLIAGLFWKSSHALMGVALAGVAAGAAKRSPAPAALLPAALLPWALHSLPAYGPGPRGRARAMAELPGRAVVDLAEMAVLARGSVRHRSPLL